jgi:hypothetical protein
MLGWLRHWRKAQRLQVRHEEEARLQRIREEHDRLAMAHQERTILASLGFDLGNADQNWLRQAQLMKEHHDRLAVLERAVDALRNGEA